MSRIATTTQAEDEAQETKDRFTAWMLRLMQLADSLRVAEGDDKREAARNALHKHAASAGARSQSRFYSGAANDSSYDEARERAAFAEFNANAEDGASPLRAWLHRARVAFREQESEFVVYLGDGREVGRETARGQSSALMQFRRSNSLYKNHPVTVRPRGRKL